MQKNIFSKRITRLSAMILSIVLLSSNAITTFAADESNVQFTEVVSADKQAEITKNFNEEFLTDGENGIQPLAAVATLGTGRWYLGNFTFTDTNTGASRTINGKFVRMCIAWKAADHTWSNVDLNVSFIRTWNSYHAKDYTFSVYDDSDGRDSDGYFYVVSPWFEVNPGSDYHMYYDAVTAPLNAKPGSLRSANVHTWLDISN